MVKVVCIVGVLLLTAGCRELTEEEQIQELIEKLRDEPLHMRHPDVPPQLECKGEKAIRPLLAGLKHELTRVRAHCALILGRMKVIRAVEPLIELLRNDTDPEVRGHAALALNMIGDSRAIQPLVRALGDNELCGHSSIGSLAGMALEKMDQKDTVNPVIGVLDSDKSNVRARAIRILGNTGSPTAVEPLIKALGDKVPDIRITAIQALCKIGDKRAIGPLIEKVKEEHAHIYTNAAEALKKLTDQDFGTDHAKWKAWYENNKDK